MVSWARIAVMAAVGMQMLSCTEGEEARQAERCRGDHVTPESEREMKERGWDDGEVSLCLGKGFLLPPAFPQPYKKPTLVGARMSLFDSLFGKGRDQEEGGGGKMEVAVCKERKEISPNTSMQKNSERRFADRGFGRFRDGNWNVVLGQSTAGEPMFHHRWGYNEGMDDELQQVFNLCVRLGYSRAATFPLIPS
eukprot:748795-Hanusia_phi.AAC.5